MMALFSYQAYARDGKKVSGMLDASSVEAVRQKLQQMNLYPITVETAREGGGAFASIKSFFQGRVTSKEIILFTKQLAVLMKSGIPLLKAMELMIEQFQGRFKSILIDLKDGLREGESLAAGMSKYPNVFDSIYVQLIRAGEATGKLEMILDRLVEFMERRQEIVSKIKGALRYPMIQLGVVILVVGLLMVFVVPQLSETFQAQGTELPLATQILVNTSEFLVSYLWLILIIVGALGIAFISWKSTKSGALTIDKLKLKLPIVKYFTKMGSVVQFCRTLGMLLDAGVNLSDALDIVVKIVDNKVLATTLEQARDKIVKEGRMAEFLEQTKIFPPIAIYLIKTGEQSGNLGAMLISVAENYETDIKEYADGLADLLNPVMLIIMAAVVGFIIMAIMGAMQLDPEALISEGT
jgi:type II secretory pathway component PulF